MKQQDEPVRLLIAASDSIIQESLLAQMIHLSVGGNYTISQLIFNPLEPTDYSIAFNSHDLILCTSTIDLPSGTKPVLVVDSCPSRCKLNTLQCLIDQIYLQKNRKLEKSSGTV